MEEGGLWPLLSQADIAVGRLDGAVKVVPDPDFFVAMYVRREAVLSAQIEGTQSTLEDLLEAELEPARRRADSDVVDIVNYVNAMRHGLARLDELPLSLRLIKEIHALLLEGARGAQATPGELRKTQNWIGAAGAPLSRATFVPPPPSEMRDAMSALELFLHREPKPPALVLAGLVHAQFETIHPFLDGNGRLGRLLVTFLLVHEGVLRQPLLYLSYFLKLHRAEYYDRLMAIRISGDWEGWMRFFLRGVKETADEATLTAVRIFELRERHRAVVLEEIGANGLNLLSVLFRQPLVNVNLVSERLAISFPTANRLLTKMEALELVREVTGRKRDRAFRYEPYVALFEDAPVPLEEAPEAVTESQPSLDEPGRSGTHER